MDSSDITVLIGELVATETDGLFEVGYERDRKDALTITMISGEKFRLDVKKIKKEIGERRVGNA
ncbi:MAG: hypothetical protein LBP79_05245 [Clostridiales bacterium]|jgi:hypothetical protein|nr:hypothetical protein [Clostridiales bacterium]